MFDDRDQERRIRLRAYQERAEKRRDGSWRGTGFTGEEYREGGHLYQSDLNILGEGSLFEYLATARTEVGRRRVARYLLHAAEADEVVARQAAIRELTPREDIREDVAAMGPFRSSDCDAAALEAWLHATPWSFPNWLRPVTLVSSLSLGLLLILILTFPVLFPWRTFAPFCLGLLAFHGAIGAWLQPEVQPRLRFGFVLAPEIAILTEGIRLLAAQKFEAPKLRGLVESARTMPASIKRLERITKWMREREKEYFYAPFLGFMVGTQMAMALEAWRIRFGSDLTAAVDAWAEFEALLAFSTYAHEHPNDVYPTFQTSSEFDATGLGHPLLVEDVCVRNDVHFGPDCRFWIISGSNMAGKSTLLRAIGTNIVLARAGAPVRAAEFRLAPFRVCASITTADSLFDGKSRFMAEVERIRDAITAAGEAPTIFLIDEIFSGTNSHDRRIAAEAVVRTLLSAGAIGALSTHDLALTEIATFPGLAGRNVHMCSRSDDQALDFDYRLKPGVNRQSNALAIARLAGVDV